jgi:hypothetical protein
MTRHDPLDQSVPPRRRPTGWFVPGAPATIVMHANLINSVVAEPQMLPGRRPPGKLATPYAAVCGRHLTGPNPKTP